MHLFMIDGIGPFFLGYDRKRINWSKVPFENLEKDGRLDPEKQKPIREAFERFVQQVASLGFNAVTLDDLAHLTDAPIYPAQLREKLQAYREEYARLFRIARNAGLQVYITTDVMFYAEGMSRIVGEKVTNVGRFLCEQIDRILEQMPEIAGVIFRIGESDGVDVEGDFQSRLIVRTPAQAKKLIQMLLPVFERHERSLVFRTWSVGAYRIGDLQWNRDTFRRVFDGITSRNLVISIKYGESDFFRYLPLNKQFFRTTHRKIIELQARREYEGFGEYPSFVGYDYEAYARALRDRDDIIGAWIWCQTGGWSRFRRLTYVRQSSPWNELNTEVALDLFREGVSAEEAADKFRERHLPQAKPAAFHEFLRLSDEVIKELLYIRGFARQKIFFRRLRMPPLLVVFWDHIMISHPLRKLLRCVVADGEGSVAEARAALVKLRRMRVLAEKMKLPTADIDFQYDTFEILAAAREYFFLPYDDSMRARLHALAKRYRGRYNPSCNVHLDLSRMRMSRRKLRMLLLLVLRRKRGYRLLDHVFTIRLLAILRPFIRKLGSRYTPAFAESQAMGLHTVLR